MDTERLHLRPFSIADAPAYLPLVSDPAVLRFTGEQPQSLEGARQVLLERPLRDYERYGFGRMACIERSSGRLVGFSGLKYLEDLQEVDIGYRFLPDCWGKGYATESAQALLRDGMARHGIRRVIGLVYPENAASARVLKKLGLVLERAIELEGLSTTLDLYATAASSPAQAWRPPGA